MSKRRFAIKLANQLGWLHVDEMLDQITPEEFEERWVADQLDPIDDSWWQASTIAATICNQLEIISRRSTTAAAVTEEELITTDAFVPKLRTRRARRRQSIKTMAERAARYDRHR